MEVFTHKVGGVELIIPNHASSSVVNTQPNLAIIQPVDFNSSFSFGTSYALLSSYTINTSVKVQGFSLITYGATGTIAFALTIGGYTLGTQKNPVYSASGVAITRDFYGGFQLGNQSSVSIYGFASTTGISGTLIIMATL